MKRACLSFIVVAVACAAAPTNEREQPRVVIVDASVDVQADDVAADVVETRVAMRCDAPRVRDSVTLECTDHAECPAGQDLAAQSCVPSCPPSKPMRDASNACACAPGTTDINGAEFGGCLEQGFSFNDMCKELHQHFDGSIMPTCKCDAGYVEYRSSGLIESCIRDCRGQPYDPHTDRCGACGRDTDHVGKLCLPKCAAGLARNPISEECDCVGGTFLDHGQCVHCTRDRTWDAKTNQCNCPAGTEDWGIDGCLAPCPSGQHHQRKRCDADCAPPLLNDEKTGACRACDSKDGAFAFTRRNRALCIPCSFDEELAASGACVCRAGFRKANGHCVRP